MICIHKYPSFCISAFNIKQIIKYTLGLSALENRCKDPHVRSIILTSPGELARTLKGEEEPKPTLARVMPVF